MDEKARLREQIEEERKHLDRAVRQGVDSREVLKRSKKIDQLIEEYEKK